MVEIEPDIDDLGYIEEDEQEQEKEEEPEQISSEDEELQRCQTSNREKYE